MKEFKKGDIVFSVVEHKYYVFKEQVSKESPFYNYLKELYKLTSLTTRSIEWKPKQTIIPTYGDGFLKWEDIEDQFRKNWLYVNQTGEPIEFPYDGLIKYIKPICEKPKPFEEPKSKLGIEDCTIEIDGEYDYISTNTIGDVQYNYTNDKQWLYAKALYLIEKQAKKFDGGNVDWNDTDFSKHTIRFNPKSLAFEIDLFNFFQNSPFKFLYFSSIEKAQGFLDSLEKEVLDVFYGIEDN